MQLDKLDQIIFIYIFNFDKCWPVCLLRGCDNLYTHKFAQAPYLPNTCSIKHLDLCQSDNWQTLWLV